MSHKLVASLAACCALVGLAACGSSDNSSTSTAAGTGASTSAAAPQSDAAKDALIQVINPLPNVFVDANNEGAKRAAKRLGLTNVQFTQSDGDAAKEVANINNAVTKGAKAIIINPVSSVGITPAIEAANAKGVCTIIAYSNIGETANDDVPEGSKAFIGWNELEGGQAVGDALAKSMGGKGGVVIIQGPAMASTSTAATILGTKDSVDSLICVAAWNTDTSTPTASTVSRMGAATISSTYRPCWPIVKTC